MTRLVGVPFSESHLKNIFGIIQEGRRSAHFVRMARLPCVVVVDVPHHVTKRGQTELTPMTRLYVNERRGLARSAHVSIR